jgi:uncharacterized protein
MTSTLERLRALAPQIRAIAKRRGAYNLRVFGSVARGDDGEGSDIDLLAEFEKSSSLFDWGGLQVELTELCGRRVDVVERNSLHPFIKDEVLAESVALLDETRA